MATHTTLSVRGAARRTVAPDHVVLHVDLRAVPAARAAVLEWLRAGQRADLDPSSGTLRS